MYSFRPNLYSVLPFAFGGIMVLYGALYFIAPAIIGTVSGDELTGFQHNRDTELFPLLMLGGGLAVVLGFGSHYLRRRVEREDEQLQTGTTAADQLAAHLKMSAGTDPVGKHRVLTGQRDGIWIDVHLERRQTRVVAQHGLKLPEGFRIQAGKARKERFGNIILDKALTATGLSHLPAHWTDPKLASVMMAVLHPHPGAFIDHKHIVVVGKLKQADLEGLLPAVAELATRLKAPVTPIQPPRFPGRSDQPS